MIVLYRSRNKDVATLNSIVATRTIVLAAKSGLMRNIVLATFMGTHKIRPFIVYPVRVHAFFD